MKSFRNADNRLKFPQFVVRNIAFLDGQIKFGVWLVEKLAYTARISTLSELSFYNFVRGSSQKLYRVGLTIKNTTLTLLTLVFLLLAIWCRICGMLNRLIGVSLSSEQQA